MDTSNNTLNIDAIPRSIHLKKDAAATVFEYLDQRKLPGEMEICETSDWRAVIDAIKTLAVRGAPAIGVAGAAGVALWCAEHAQDADVESYAAAFSRDAELIASARPTAVNLRWAVEQACALVEGELAEGFAPASVAEKIYEFALELEHDDERINRQIGENGAELLASGTRVLTHCNAGSLATAFYGTALGVVYAAAEQGKIERVYSDETRPLGQGARLTVWELSRAGVPVTLICDDMAASLIAHGGVDAVIVGADRIARNGDTANKIGTLGVAVLAHEFGVPFYVAAPFSTFDASLEDGSGIPIEERAHDEVLPRAIDGVDVWNPAFDVTPARYIAGIITERGVYAPGEIAGVLERL